MKSPILKDNRLSKSLDQLLRQKSPFRKAVSDAIFSLEFVLIEIICAVQLDKDPVQQLLVDPLYDLLKEIRCLQDTPFYYYRTAYFRFMDSLTAFCRQFVMSEGDAFGSTCFLLERRGNNSTFRVILSY